MTALAIDVRGLTKRFGTKTAVDHVDIAVPEGEVWGFLGPNGSGKTTTIRMLCGLLRPDEGSGTCLGFDILRESEKIKREVGYMTQKFSFWEDLSIRENLQFTAEVYELDRRKQRVDDALQRLGLVERQKQLAGELSGVDPKARRDFWDEIHRLSAEGLTVLVSTHYMDEAERCDRIVYINRGKMIARGTVAEVIERSGLITFVIEGEGARHLVQKLQNASGVEFIAFFGAALHVSGHDRQALEASLAPYRNRPGLDLRESAPSLEDIFIQLQEGAG